MVVYWPDQPQLPDSADNTAANGGLPAKHFRGCWYLRYWPKPGKKPAVEECSPAVLQERPRSKKILKVGAQG
jgi:hypothetical protein